MPTALSWSPSTPSSRVGLAALLLLSALPAKALFTFNDGQDKINLTAYLGTGYDSNINARGSLSAPAGTQSDDSDVVFHSGVSLIYLREAGSIGVNGSLGWDTSTFASAGGQDFFNPSAALTFTKHDGRATGSLAFNAQRSSDSDPTVGLRSESWNYGVKLNYRYPIISRYSIGGDIGWDRQDFSGSNSGGTAATNTFVDQDTYSIGTDFLYSLRSDRSLMVGHRYRNTETGATSSSGDHSVYTGLSGRLLSKLSGSARVGWSFRTTEFPDGTPDESNDGLFISMSSTWAATRKASYTLALSQDFSTTSANYQTQTSSIDLTGAFTHTKKLGSQVNLGARYTEFLSGFATATTPAPIIIPVYTPGFNGQDRTDSSITAGTGLSYKLSEHFTVSADYSYETNTSSLSGFTYDRHSIQFRISTTW